MTSSAVRYFASTLFAVLLVSSSRWALADDATPNTLTDAEKKEGWKLLFDGKTTAGWRNFKKQDISQGWQVIGGALCRVDKTAGDINGGVRVTGGNSANCGAYAIIGNGLEFVVFGKERSEIRDRFAARFALIG